MLASLLTAAVTLPWLEAEGVDASLFSRDVLSPLIGAVIVTTLAGSAGIGVGVLLTNQPLAITLVVVWTALVESLVVGFLPEVGRWLPTGATSALAGTSTTDGGLLPFWAAAIVFACYAIGLAAAGERRLARREIT